MSALLLDTHAVHWWTAEPTRLSRSAQRALDEAEELLIAAISWHELAWLARHGRISVDIPIRTWLDELGANVRTVGLTPAIADTAVSLPSSFPGDPADRLIYASAIQQGTKLVTKDRSIAKHDAPRNLVLW